MACGVFCVVYEVQSHARGYVHVYTCQYSHVCTNNVTCAQVHTHTPNDFIHVFTYMYVCMHETHDKGRLYVSFICVYIRKYYYGIILTCIHTYKGYI